MTDGIIGPIVCAVALLFLVDRFGRKPLLLVGTVICCIAMATEAAIQNYYPADSTNYAAHRAGVAMIAIFSVGFSFSYGPISWIYASEVFPNRIRHIGVAASVSCNDLLSCYTKACIRPAHPGPPTFVSWPSLREYFSAFSCFRLSVFGQTGSLGINNVCHSQGYVGAELMIPQLGWSYYLAFVSI